MATQELPVKPPAKQKLIRTNQLKFLWKLLEKMVKEDCATEFYSVQHNLSVKNPMDLKTVQLRLNNHFYVRGRDCIKDVHLIFSNASKHYYPDSIQVQNAKALENFFYAKLDDMPKPECELPAISDKNSKPTKPKKKEKKISPIRRKNESKISYCSSKIKKMPKIMERKEISQKKISSKDKNMEIKKFQTTVQEIMSDLSKLYRPLDFVDNLKLYDSLLKVKLMHEKFQTCFAFKQKEEDLTKIVNTSLGTSTTKKSNLHKPSQRKEKIVVLPSKSVGAGAGLLLSDQKDVQLKLKNNKTLLHKVKSNKEKININSNAKPSNSILTSVDMVKRKKENIDKIPDIKPERKAILPSANMLKPKNEEVQEKPKNKTIISNLNVVKPQNEIEQNNLSDLEMLLKSERFRPLDIGPIVTEERKRLREIAQQKRESLGGKINFYGPADSMQAFEIEHGIYQYNSQNNKWPKNTFTGS